MQKAQAWGQQVTNTCLFSGPARERREQQVERPDKIFNGWLKRGMQTAIVWTCCQITQSDTFFPIAGKRDLRWALLFHYSLLLHMLLWYRWGKNKDLTERLAWKKKSSSEGQSTRKLSTSILSTELHSKLSSKWKRFIQWCLCHSFSRRSYSGIRRKRMSISFKTTTLWLIFFIWESSPALFQGLKTLFWLHALTIH